MLAQVDNKSKPIVLLYPPPSDPTQPYSSLPALTAFLRHKQFKVIQRDLAVELLNQLLSPQMLEKARQAAIRRLKRQANTVKNGYLESFYEISDFSDYIIANINSAKDIMRDKNQFYNLVKYEWATRLINLSCRLASLPYYPTLLLPAQYRSPYKLTLKGLTKATSKRRDNLFYKIFDQEIVPQVIALQPLLIGISVTYYDQIIPAFTLARLIKMHNPKLHICIGGAIIQHLTNAFFDDPTCFQFADSFCVGEGETTLYNLAQSLLSDTSKEPISNLVTKKQSDLKEAKSNYNEDINVLPCPDFDGLDLNAYLSPEPVFLLATTRGCYFGKCAFCNVSAHKKKTFRGRNSKKLIQDIRKLHEKYSVKHFIFCDDAMPPPIMLEVAKLVKNNLTDITWSAEARFEKAFTPEFLVYIKQGGCRNLIFGLESANQRVLDLMNKGNSAYNDLEIIKNCGRVGIYLNLQCFIGFPTETKEEAWQTANLLVDNQRFVSSYGFGYFSLEDGTPIFLNPKAYGIKRIYRQKNSILETDLKYDISKGMTKEEVLHEYDLCNEKLASTFNNRIAFLGGGSGTHALLQMSHFDHEKLYKLWEDRKNSFNIDNLKLENLTLDKSLLILSVPSNLGSYYQTALCCKTGRQFYFSKFESKLLNYFNGKLTVTEILSLITKNDSFENELKATNIANAVVTILGFIKHGIVQKRP